MSDIINNKFHFIDIGGNLKVVEAFNKAYEECYRIFNESYIITNN